MIGREVVVEGYGPGDLGGLPVIVVVAKGEK